MGAQSPPALSLLKPELDHFKTAGLRTNYAMMRSVNTKTLNPHNPLQRNLKPACRLRPTVQVVGQVADRALGWAGRRRRFRALGLLGLQGLLGLRG